MMRSPRYAGASACARSACSAPWPATTLGSTVTWISLSTSTEPTDFDRFMGLKAFLENALGAPVDLVTEKAIRPRLRPYIEREAVRVA